MATMYCDSEDGKRLMRAFGLNPDVYSKVIISFHFDKSVTIETIEYMRGPALIDIETILSKYVLTQNETTE